MKKCGPALSLAFWSTFALAAASPGLAQPKQAVEAQAAKPAQIDRNGVLILIRTTLLALHQANETGNYTVLRDLSAPGFRDANNAARLGEIFGGQRVQKLDLSGVAVLDPQLTVLPQIEANGMLRIAGFFPSVPSQVEFELLFAPVEGRWRPFGISVNVGSSTPAAPQPPQQLPASEAGVKSQATKAPSKASPVGPAGRASPPVEKKTTPEVQPGSP